MIEAVRLARRQGQERRERQQARKRQEQLSALREATDRLIRDGVIEDAGSLTVDKFSLLPEEGGVRAAGQSRSRGVDCRHYLRAFLEHITAARAERGDIGALELETLAARRLARHVARHFELSILERKRAANPHRRRYVWKRNGAALTVYFPRDFPGAQSRQWLEANVEDPDFIRFGERERVQGIIDRGLLTQRSVDPSECDPANECAAGEAISWAAAYGVSADGLARTIAEEKAARIDEMRPRVRQLGPDNLKALVLAVFDSLGDGESRDGDIAKRFALSPATFSRFAGSRWRALRNGFEIPDLWRNTARVIGRSPLLTEAAKAAGVWLEVRKAAGTDGLRREESGAP